ncbi:Uncharacterised protein [Pseudescherichia vulneris]|nr:Uncharacterised protein [Pseudescherichia vulneris]
MVRAEESIGGKDEVSLGRQCDVLIQLIVFIPLHKSRRFPKKFFVLPDHVCI